MTDDLEAGPVCAAATCTRPAAPVLCLPDTRRLGDWLAQLGTEYELLSAAPSMQGREPGTIGGGALSSQRAAGNTHVMALQDRRHGLAYNDVDPWGLDNTPSVFDTLATYAALVRAPVEHGGRGLTGPRMDLAYVRAARPLGPVCDPHGPRCGHHTCEVWTFRANVAAPLTVATERKVLAAHLDWILGQGWAGEFHDEIRALWGLLRRANGHAAPTRRVHRIHAPCAACGVRAVTHRPGSPEAVCENCGHTVDLLEQVSA